jgi:hypothetical protein
MGARAAKQRAANRTARKRTSASPAPAEGSASATGDEKQVSSLTSEQPILTNLKMAPTRKTRGARRKNPLADAAPAPTKAGTMAHMTQGADNSLSDADKNLSAEDEQDDNVNAVHKLPERRAREGFTAILAQIAEEPDFDEADRSIGHYAFHDEEWESWKAGPGERDDEYEVGGDSDSDGAQSNATTIAGTKLPVPPWRRPSVSKPPKHQIGKTKVAGGSKRKRLYLDSDDDTESDSESDIESECVVFLDA